jgi:hypothetical protein
MKKNKTKNIAIIALSFLAVIGTYNAVMINSESHLGDASNFKRLDEVFGVVKTGRNLAVANDWKKIEKVAATPAAKIQASASSVSAPVEVSDAAIQEDLKLKLVEVINPKKWVNGITSAQFSGAIATNYGVIESLTASLPEGLNVEISFSEMTGNTFEYDLNGEVYTAMMYQVDKSQYMITMTNGPLEGTRMRFAGEEKESSQAEYLAETHNIEVQEFGAQTEAPEVVETEQAAVAQSPETASFNF